MAARHPVRRQGAAAAGVVVAVTGGPGTAFEHGVHIILL